MISPDLVDFEKLLSMIANVKLLFSMPETPEMFDHIPEPSPEREAVKLPEKPTRKETTWSDLSEEAKRQLRVWSCLQARDRRIQRQLQGEPTPPTDPLPPPLYDPEPAPPVDIAALRRLVSDEEMIEEEINALFGLINKHRIWYDTYHQLLRQETKRRLRQQGIIS